MSLSSTLGRFLGGSPSIVTGDRPYPLPLAGGGVASSQPDSEELSVLPSSLPAAELAPVEPTMADLHAAVALVEAGLATHVVLSGFPSWPGLLWKAQELAREAHVSIVPRAATGDGRVDLEVSGELADGD